MRFASVYLPTLGFRSYEGHDLFLGPYLSFEDSQEATVALFRGFQNKEVVFFLQTFIFLKYAEWGSTQTGKKNKQ